jgi:hypothetical protein
MSAQRSVSHAATKMIRLRVMLEGVPAFIMGVLFAALFYPAPVRQRGLRFAPPLSLSCAGPRYRCDQNHPRGGWHTSVRPLELPLCSAHRLL